MPDDLDSPSIFSKVIGHKLSDGSRDYLYLCCRMNFTADVVQNQASKFMNLGIPPINTLDESGVLGTPATRIRRLTDGYYYNSPDHFFGEVTVVGMSAEE